MVYSDKPLRQITRKTIETVKWFENNPETYGRCCKYASRESGSGVCFWKEGCECPKTGNSCSLYGAVEPASIDAIAEEFRDLPEYSNLK